MSLELTQVQAVTNDYWDKKLYDIFFTENVLLYMLMAGGKAAENIVKASELVDGGQMIRTPVSQVRIVGRSSQGVTIFRTGKDEKVVSVERLADSGGDDEDGEADDAPAIEGGES